MKKINILYGILLLISVGVIQAITFSEAQFLKEIYAKGTAKLLDELTIDESSLPEGLFLESIIDIALDGAGMLYACDMYAHNIKKFTTEGKFIKVIGREGQGPGEFNWPWTVAASKDGIIVFDMRNRRLCALTAEGEHLKSITVQRAEGQPRIMKSLPNSDVVIEREIIHFGEGDKPQDCVIQVYAPDLTLKKTIISQPVWRNKYRQIQGMFTNIIQPFSPQVHWDVTSQGNIIFGFSADYTIEIHHVKKGKLSTFPHKYDPVKVTDEDKEKFFASLTSSTSSGSRTGVPKEIKDMTEFPKNKPAFTNILVDPEGNILVFPSQKISDTPEIIFDAFDPDGTFIGRVKLDSKTAFPYSAEVHSGFVWVIESNEKGLSKIVKYRITA
ncbi:MAG: hypothetical protein JW755_12545 [Candidatus Aminicenantes bacterium]|nr:hypothetical protein [Candidatus Aminicenantes bacterium]